MNNSFLAVHEPPSWKRAWLQPTARSVRYCLHIIAARSGRSLGVPGGAICRRG